MSTGLPDALFNITTQEVSITTPAESSHEVRFLRYWTLARFWKISFVNHKAIRTPAARRAENIFWRLWSDPVHRETIGEGGLLELCNICQQPFNNMAFELTMPCESASRPSQVHHHAGKFSCDTSSDEYLELGHASGFPKDINTSPEGGVHDDLVGVKVQTVQSHPSTRPKASRSTSSHNTSTRANSNHRERPAAAGGSTGSKLKRPTLGRRLNSSSQYIKPSKSPTLASRSSQRNDGKSVKPKNESSDKGFELPSASSWEDEPYDGRKHDLSRTDDPEADTELGIDPDFRNKFAEKVASSSSLALPSRMRKTGSIVRFATDPPQIELDDAGNDTLSQGSKLVGQRPILSHRHSTSSVAISDDDDGEEPSPHLPRTRSQLSFLISERRATHGEESLGEQPILTVSKSSKDKIKQAEDEEILAMARRQGVTKAGGIQVPLQHRVDNEIDSRYSSPDRDNTF